MTPDDRPHRPRDVKRFLARNGIREAYLVKGEGYFCFDGPATGDWKNHTVLVSFLSDLTYDQWLRTFKAMDENPGNRESAWKRS